MERIRTHFTSAHLIAMLALFVALGGTTYAALKLPKNSVGAKQIKKNAVRSGKVKNGSLLKKDFRAGQLPRGRRGIPGINGTDGQDGAPGAPGEAAAFARVGAEAGRPLQPNIAGFPPQVKNVTQAGVVPGEAAAATGTTCFKLDFRPSSAVVALDNADAGTNVDLIASVAIDRGEDLGDCPGTHNSARVRIVDTDLTAGGAEQDPGPANARFFIWFEK
jgi:hypothetical protein